VVYLGLNVGLWERVALMENSIEKAAFPPLLTVVRGSSKTTNKGDERTRRKGEYLEESWEVTRAVCPLATRGGAGKHTLKRNRGSPGVTI